MSTIVASVLCSVAVSVLLKVARGRSLAVDQVIAFNYVAAATLCLVLLRPPLGALPQSPDSWWLFGALGLLLPSIFLVMAAAVRHAGIVLSDAAQRLSLFLSLLAAFVLFDERLGGQKLAGAALAVCALVLLVTKPAGGATLGRAAPVLLAVWVGYGVIDVLFKQLSKTGAAFSATLFVTFVLAGTLLFGWLLLRRTRWALRNVVAGLLLGALNFGNIYFYIRAHQLYPESPTLVFSTMNIGVISLGTLVGAGVFGERPSRLNYAGVGLAVVAIVVLATGM